MKMDSGSANTFVVYGSQTGRLAGIYSGDGSNTLRFDSNNKFKIGEEIEVTLTIFLTSTDGVSLELPIVYRFRAETLNGNGSFKVRDTIEDQTGASALAAGDWDGDGDLDAFVGNDHLEGGLPLKSSILPPFEEEVIEITDHGQGIVCMQPLFGQILSPALDGLDRSVSPGLRVGQVVPERIAFRIQLQRPVIGRDGGLVESTSGHARSIAGHKSFWKTGVSGTALQFDGYNTVVSLPAAHAPAITRGLTLEGWVAIGAYPWNWIPIASAVAWMLSLPITWPALTAGMLSENCSASRTRSGPRSRPLKSVGV